MEDIQAERFTTETHSENIDFIFDKEIKDISTPIWENPDIRDSFKAYFRLFRKKFSNFYREKMHKNFKNIVYLTLDCPPYSVNTNRLDSPLEYIVELQKQYPDKDIRVLIPIINVSDDFKTSKKLILDIGDKQRVLEKTSLSFNFFLQNRNQEATVYKFPKNNTNVQVYGLYSPSFSFCRDTSEVSRLHHLAPFLKASRIAIKKMSTIDFQPDIVHCENIPFFLGAEFENKISYPVKVLQIVKDFMQIDVAKQEAFWAAINLADKSTMRKICNDMMIKKCVANLFKLRNTQSFYPIKDCLKYVYKNYFQFRKYIDKGEDIDENIIINRLNARIIQMFPNIAQGDELYFNTMIQSIKKADFWAVMSKTYYEEIFENPEISGVMYKQLLSTKNKSCSLSFGLDTNKYPLEKTRDLYQGFNLSNFREMRSINKTALVKEFSEDRIKTNFVDPTLFQSEKYEIVGSLDSFYDSPLFFAYSTPEIFANGVDILFNTILKLFELHKNFQVIICVKDGLKSSFVKNWLDFVQKHKYFNGRWVFIDANINMTKFLSASDMILIPRRANMTSPEHYLAMHYGCVPIVAKTGILNDTISDIFDDINLGCGFKTKTSLLTNEDPNDLFITPVMKALNIYQNNPSSWNLLVKNCLNKPCGWSFEILEKYNNIYEELV